MTTGTHQVRNRHQTASRALGTHTSLGIERALEQSKVTLPPPGHGGPPGGPASMVHSPTSASRRSRATVLLDSLIANRSSKCTRIHCESARPVTHV